VKKALLLLLVPGAALAQPELFIEAELSPGRVYAGAEARLVLRVLRAPGVAPGTLKPPRLDKDAGELSLLTVRNYEETRNGIAYRVFERTNVVVPRAAGSLVIPGAEFESAAYFTEQFARSALPRVLRGPEQVLEVLPVPAGAGEPFLPARSLGPPSRVASWSVTTWNRRGIRPRPGSGALGWRFPCRQYMAKACRSPPGRETS